MISSFMKRSLSILVFLLLIQLAGNAQVERAAAGLSFSQKIRFNNGDTGNPGLNLKTWINLDKRHTMSIVPSVTAYMPHVVTPNSSYYTTTYLFHGDLDFQYKFFQEKTLSVVAFSGVNYTHIIVTSTTVADGIVAPEGGQTHGFGPNLGVGLEMRMSDHWDFNVNAKYAFPGLQYKVSGTQSFFNELKPALLSSPLTALVIQAQAVYYFTGRSKGFRR